MGLEYPLDMRKQRIHPRKRTTGQPETNRVRELRQALGITQLQLAAVLGCHLSSVAYAEQEKRVFLQWELSQKFADLEKQAAEKLAAAGTE
jgi:transcriptional regulator with XRE-family HTH domain